MPHCTTMNKTHLPMCYNRVSNLSTLDDLKQESTFKENRDGESNNVCNTDVQMTTSEENWIELFQTEHLNKIVKEMNNEPKLQNHSPSIEEADKINEIQHKATSKVLDNPPIKHNNICLHSASKQGETFPINENHNKNITVKEVQEKVSSVKTQETNDSISAVKEILPIQLKNVRQMNMSVIGPTSKNYLAEGSLFFSDREAVLVFGGIDPNCQYGVGHNTGKDIYRYQPESDNWELVGELPEPRQHHSVAFLKGRVFLAGGADPRDDDVRGKSIVVSTVWSYEPVKRSWFSESGMLSPRKNFGLIASNGKLYAIGGQDRQGSWFPFTSLRFPICFGRFFSISDCLYIIGGAGRMTDRDCTTSSTGIIDVWDNSEKNWHQLAEMSIPRHGHSVAYLGTQIFIIGGVTTVYMRALNNVECFCCERKTWIRGVSNLPTTLSGQDSITLPPASLM